LETPGNAGHGQSGAKFKSWVASATDTVVSIALSYRQHRKAGRFSRHLGLKVGLGDVHGVPPDPSKTNSVFEIALRLFGPFRRVSQKSVLVAALKAVKGVAD
jgi:hypothetical protein